MCFSSSFHLVYKFKLTGIDSSDTHTKEWYQVQAVLRVSLGNFLFFVVLALIMIGVKDQNDRRDSWHHGGWTVKTVIWLLLIVLAFFIPDAVTLAYGMLCNPYFLPLGSLWDLMIETSVFIISAGFISKFGAGLFLLIQVLILLDCTHSWNDAWVEKDEQKWYD